MTDLHALLEAVNPVPENSADRDPNVPPFETIWLAAQRSTASDYPARSRRLALWRGVGAASAVLAAGIVAAVVLLSSGAPVAFAGWTPTPTTPTPAAVAAATVACNSLNLPQGALSGLPVLTDARGPYTAAIYRSGDQVQDCISDGTRKGSYASFSTALKFRAVPGPDQLGNEVSAGGGSGAPAHLEGLAGSDVTAVTFTFAGGATVAATVQNGWYFLWWPNTGLPTSVQLTTRSGQTITSQFGCSAGTSTCVFAGNRPGAFANHPTHSPAAANPKTTTTP